MDWLAATTARRTDPSVLWPEARSVIMLGLNYGPDGDPLAILQQRDRGAISVYAQGDDYHELIKAKLKAIARWLIANAGGDVKVFVDTAAVMEKPLAASAGLGWQGKHTNLVSREHGSWLFLGAIFTTLELPPDAAEIDHCGSCRACLDVCPTNAFPAPYRLDARRCISYLTIEHKGPIPRELRPLMGNRIYGCDDCLAVCPWNKFAQAGREAKLAAREALRAPKLAELARLDDAAFRALFAKSPVKRTGRDRFIRNVLIAIGNTGDRALAAEAERLLDDASPLVRGAAVWALGRLDPQQLGDDGGEARSARRTSPCARMDGGVNAHPVLLRSGIFGFALPPEFGARFDRIAGTVTTREKAATIAGAGIGGRTVEAFVFAGNEASPEIEAALMDAAALLVSAPPDDEAIPCCAISPAPSRARRSFRQSSPSPPSASMATTPARGSTRRRWLHPSRIAAARGSPPSKSGTRLDSAPASRSRSCGSRESTAPVRTRSSRSRAATPSASISQARCSTAFMSRISRRRSMPPSRSGRRHLQRHRRRADAAGRARHVRGGIARRRAAARHPVRRGRKMSPMALSFYAESKRVRNDKLKRAARRHLRYPTICRGIARACRTRAG